MQLTRKKTVKSAKECIKRNTTKWEIGTMQESHGGSTQYGP